MMTNMYHPHSIRARRLRTCGGGRAVSKRGSVPSSFAVLATAWHLLSGRRAVC